MRNIKINIKSLVITLATLIILLSNCDGKQKKPKTPEELKAELLKYELMNLMVYLDDKDVTLQQQRKKVRNAGLFRDAEYADDGALIKGSIINKATLAKYKDVKVRVTYYSKTKTLIQEKTYVFYEFYNPNSKKQFSLKVEPPIAYKTFGFELIDANGVLAK
jgi:hypothetical protein